MNARKVIFILSVLIVIAACSTTRSLQDGEYLLRSNKVEVNDKHFKASELTSYMAQKPNSYMLGMSPFLSVYNWGGQSQKPLARFWRKLGQAPVVYDPAKVDATIGNIQNHLRYIGYYGSQVESSVQVKGRKVYVTYYVALGKQFTISAIDYQLPQYGTFAQEFKADLPNSTIGVGSPLAESLLESEANRSARYFRTLGYYGFNKSFYVFQADTLAGDNNAKLTMTVRDYALGDIPSAAQEHKKFTLGEVTVSRPQRLKLRQSVIENLNTLRPGALYDERDINTVYDRFSSVNMLSGVNVELTPASDTTVNCNITLRNSDIQGFKTNLEASVNSTALIGISPQLTYFHKNLFHGGELFNLGIKGNFQFKAKDSAYTTEVSITSSLRFPKFLGLPNRIFKGPYIPRTDINLSFSYQDRPEFRRTLISTSFSYSGRFTPNFFYQFTPFRANITRLFGINDEFIQKVSNNLVMLFAYSNKFDMGVSSMLYYTTNTSPLPKTPYHYVRFSADVAGNVLSLFNPLLPMNGEGDRTIWNTPYAQYVRAELNLGKTFRFGRMDKHALALHFMAGAGYAYGNSYVLPLERMFYCGGATSMRGWQARSLGPGNDTSIAQYFSIPSQVGDMKLEANIEYRFPIYWKFEGALFADAGNIWDLDYDGSWKEGEMDPWGFGIAELYWQNLGESLGLNWGLGLRLNLDFILLRIDAGFRIHDPGCPEGKRWIAPRYWFPDKYAIHFGVGYPF